MPLARAAWVDLLVNIELVEVLYDNWRLCVSLLALHLHLGILERTGNLRL